MTWFFLSLACAFFSATIATLFKLILKKRNEFLVVWSMFAFALPVFFVVFLIVPKPHFGLALWKTVALMLPVEITAFLLYMRSLKISPLSLVFPFLGLTPVFTILTSFFILGETLSLYGIIGVFMVSFGAYTLNMRSIKDGLLAPIKNIYKEKGVFLMIIVAFLYGITATLGKRAVILSSPLSFPAVYFSIFFLILTPIAIVKLVGKKHEAKQNIENNTSLRIKNNILLFFVAGILFSATILLHYKAISLVKVSYMISVKRLSLVISVIYGGIVFKEKAMGYRILGSSIMVLGIAILSLTK